MLDKIKVRIQYIIPNKLITKIAGLIARCKFKWLVKCLIKVFIYKYKININKSKEKKISSYSTLNSFFVRPISEETRPINQDPAIIVSPVDGTILQFGKINNDQIFQAKGKNYSINSLLACNKHMVDSFKNGIFTTIYIAPNNYHRVHMPCDSILRYVLYVPGKLFSVNPSIVSYIPNLFSRNERLICCFDTDFGPMAQILIGSTIIGSIETTWMGAITPPREGIIKCWDYPEKNSSEAIIFKKGEEMGRFNIGSMVINLFSKNSILLDTRLSVNHITKIGKPLARII